jgi:ketopantoate reductase
MSKIKVLIVGGGGVGTMAAYALESAGEAEVTMVLRSNFSAVKQNGFAIDSIQHGHDIAGWRPSHLIEKVPSAQDVAAAPFDYIIVATKNIPDVKPTVIDIIEQAVTPGKTSILLLQNGLNIEKPIITRFPDMWYYPAYLSSAPQKLSTASSATTTQTTAKSVHSPDLDLKSSQK